MDPLEKEQRTIKTIGKVLIVLSSMVIAGNSLGILSFTMLGFGNIENSEPAGNITPMDWLFEHYYILCMSMIIIGTLYLFGSIYLTKFKLLANRLVSIVSSLLFFIIWILMILMVISMKEQIELKIFRILAVSTALFCSAPLVILIRYLNKRSTLKYFS